MLKQFKKHFSNCSELSKVLLLVGLLALLPDVVLAGFFDEVASSFSKSRASQEEITKFVIYCSAIVILFILLNLVREKRGGSRLMALLAIQLLFNTVLVFYLYL